MPQALLLCLVVLGILNLVLLAVLVGRRRDAGDQSAASAAIRDELRLGREESARTGKELREELTQGLRFMTDVVGRSISEMGGLQKAQLETMTGQLKASGEASAQGLEATRKTLADQLSESQRRSHEQAQELRTTLQTSLKGGAEESAKKARELREEVQSSLKSSSDTMISTLSELARQQAERLEGFARGLSDRGEAQEQQMHALRSAVDERLGQIQKGSEEKLGEVRRLLEEKLLQAAEDAARSGKNLREEVTGGLKATSETVVKTMGELGLQQSRQMEQVGEQIKELTASTRKDLEALRSGVDQQLKEMREGNEKKLEEMRKTVDEQLQGTLEKRLGESFQLVSERLEAVQRGLGEMQSLAVGVGDLKKVLSNVKVRGTWAEVQLGAILEQILTTDQFARNVQTKSEGREFVEYAIRLPGREGPTGSCMWLPIDSKFPNEDYARLIEASENGDAEGAQAAALALGRAVRAAAESIRDKYLDPPHTTDFAILFLPTEGLYAEVLRQPALMEQLQQNCHVVVAGPTTLVAILSSLRMGFRTLAIEKRAGEVWNVLAAVKTEFGKFGHVLEKVGKQLSTASNTIEQTKVRTRAMERKLRGVEELPEVDESSRMALPPMTDAVPPLLDGPGEATLFARP